MNRRQIIEQVNRKLRKLQEQVERFQPDCGTWQLLERLKIEKERDGLLEKYGHDSHFVSRGNSDSLTCR